MCIAYFHLPIRRVICTAVGDICWEWTCQYRDKEYHDIVDAYLVEYKLHSCMHVLCFYKKWSIASYRFHFCTNLAFANIDMYTYFLTRLWQTLPCNQEIHWKESILIYDCMYHCASIDKSTGILYLIQRTVAVALWLSINAMCTVKILQRKKSPGGLESLRCSIKHYGTVTVTMLIFSPVQCTL